MKAKTYFSLNVTNRCNKACAYCVNADYINNAEYPDLMNFDDLSNWLEKEIHDDDIVEIAGTGEPTLCGWLPDLLRYLEQKKAWVMLRTNGFKLGEWRLALGRLLVILSKHDSGDDYVTDKCKYLLPNDLILSRIENELEKGEVGKPLADALSLHGTHNISRAFFVTPDGKVRFMPCQPHEQGTVWDYKPERWTCVGFGSCVFVLGAYNFIEYLKSPFDLPSGHSHVQVGEWIKNKGGAEC